MEKEVAEAVNISIAMVLMAALIGIVSFTVFIGNQVKNDSIEQAVKIADEVASGYFNSIEGKDTVMPAAAAYSILIKGDNVIASSECKIPGIPGEEYSNAQECLKTHLTGKVSLEVIKITEGQFKVVIHDAD